ncbi:MAG: 2-amino-4-hydroxy-6-hydroxymethyldihydropteridine diphosphokinase [Clostridia bacterium]|nr:2-amino-4-hydroxy-6-hydroxymethyldihydropteridine diphosphokinase [Clostridia bacterium]
MKDTISVTGIEAHGYIGVYAKEKKVGQKFIVDFTLHFGSIGATDRLDDTVDYSKAAQRVKSYIESAECDLIETAAADIARMLIRENGVTGVSVTVHKPEAPIGFKFSDVSVTCNLLWQDVCLGLGSNIGDKRAHLDYAVAKLKECEHCKDLTVSDYYVTSPYGVVDQDDFVNACVRLHTYLTPLELLDMCLAIEKERGRERTLRWGPRTLDIDILLYGREVISSPSLTVPHPDMDRRRFVLEPLSDIAGDFIHPLIGKSIRRMSEELKD